MLCDQKSALQLNSLALLSTFFIHSIQLQHMLWVQNQAHTHWHKWWEHTYIKRTWSGELKLDTTLKM